MGSLISEYLFLDNRLVVLHWKPAPGNCYTKSMSLFFRVLFSVIAITMPLFFINCSTTNDSIAATETAPKTEIATPAIQPEKNN
tara:strand:- start:32230 stop:32481 length:252 start_codon:yes stop_codon:yes gene_type:complete